MYWLELVAAVAALAGVVTAKEMAVNEARSKELYQSGKMMEMIMMHKEVSFYGGVGEHFAHNY